MSDGHEIAAQQVMGPGKPVIVINDDKTCLKDMINNDENFFIFKKLFYETMTLIKHVS